MSDGQEFLQRVRDVRRRLAENSRLESRGQGDFERVSLSEGDADALRDLFIADKSRVVVEIGLAYASSALAILEALLVAGADGARHLVIDAFQDRFDDAGWNSITAAGLTEVCSLVRERSQLVLPQLIRDGFVADAASWTEAICSTTCSSTWPFCPTSYGREGSSSSMTASGPRSVLRCGTFRSTPGGNPCRSKWKDGFAPIGYPTHRSNHASRTSNRSGSTRRPKPTCLPQSSLETSHNSRPTIPTSDLPQSPACGCIHVGMLKLSRR